MKVFDLARYNIHDEIAVKGVMEKKKVIYYLGLFAKLVRKNLTYARKNKISLEEDISAINSYLEMEKLSKLFVQMGAEEPQAAVMAIESMRKGQLKVKSLQEYYS